MKPNYKKFAPLGFYLSVLAGLVSLVLIIIRQEFDLFLQISLGFILIGLALAVIFDPNKARELLTGRQAKYSSNTFILTLAVVGILVVVNYLANGQSIRWDLTENQENTLSNESHDVLASMPEKVTALAFFTPNYPTADTSRLLSNFKSSSLGKFDFQFIDPDNDPVSAKAANVTRDGTIVLKMAGRQEQVTYPDEQEITSALIRLANPGTRVLYFLTGHGEVELNSSSGKGISLLKIDLESKNYTVKSLNLFSTPIIPDDALAIIIDRPLQPLSASEVQLIKSFLASGKSLLLLMEPRPLTDFNDLSDPLADYLEKTWGIAFSEDILIDPNVNPPLAAAADFYGNHLITQKMQGLVTIFPSARSLTIQPEMDQIITTELVKSSLNSWGETEFASIESNQVTFDESEDFPGPLTIAAAAENIQNKSRIVVIGDSDFASDENYRSYGNGVLIANAIDWAAQQDNLIHLTVREKTQRMILPPQQFTLGLVLFGSIFLVPLLILFSGIVVFIQRRRRV